MPKTLTQEHKQALQEGRRKALEKGREEAVKRVIEYRKWLKRDAKISKMRQEGIPVEREPMPTVPSNHDYEIADIYDVRL